MDDRFWQAMGVINNTFDRCRKDDTFGAACMTDSVSKRHG